MSSALVECVPNFSEGRDQAVIDAIAEAIRAAGAVLLDVDPGKATNRTVMTFVAPPEVAMEAAFQAIKLASEKIDMRRHKGEHPRIGATDVCPFVPLQGIDMAGCAALARQLGARVGEELGIPVYLYEAAASRPERKNLADIRAGEYEGLAAKLQDPEWAPDFGPAAMNERAGATVIGARPFLIAWNVNLNTRDKRKANRIGGLIREQGLPRRDEHGVILRDEQGVALRDPGLFRHVKAIGWYIAEYDRAQISINFTDWTVSPPHLVVDEIRRLADQEGVVVTGCELVGLIPLDAVLEAGRHYLRRQGANPGAPENELVEVAVRSLGLRDLGPFDADQRIIERRIRKDGRLVSQTLRQFTDTLSSAAPAPGGGSVSALCGALSAGLTAMVGALTTGKKGYEADWAAHDVNAVRAQALREAFLADIDADTAAFDAVMAAFGLPKKTPEEQAARAAAIQQATLEATLVPLRVLERCVEAVRLSELSLRGNANARSDAGVAVLTARAAAEGAYYNVCINLKGLDDEPTRTSLRARATAALETVRLEAERLSALVRAEL